LRKGSEKKEAKTLPGAELKADEGSECLMEERELRPMLGDLGLLWDGAPHLPSHTHTHVTAFPKYSQEAGDSKVSFLHTRTHRSAELFFSDTKRCIKRACTVSELVQRLRGNRTSDGRHD
jgi:hypothetical protein